MSVQYGCWTFDRILKVYKEMSIPFKETALYKEFISTDRIYELKRPRDTTPGYTFSIAWDYPRFAMKFYNPAKGIVRLETFGLQVYDINRALIGDAGQIIFVSRTSHSINCSPYNSTPALRLVELYRRVVNIRNNKLHVCLARN